MACALLPVGVAAAAVPSPRRRADLFKEISLRGRVTHILPVFQSLLGHPNQVACMNQIHQLHRKLPLTGECCCTPPGSSAEAATSSRTADVSSGHNDASTKDPVDVPGTPIVISGYWIGPDMDDGCGHIQAILQRVS